MGLAIGLPRLTARHSRTLTISVIALVLGLLAGPASAFTIPPSSAGMSTAPIGTIAHGAGLTLSPAARMAHSSLPSTERSSIYAQLHPTTRPAWLPGTSSPSDPLTSGMTADAEIAHASASLAAGLGPAHGTPLSCSGSGGSSECAPAHVASSPHPAAATELWQNGSFGDTFFGNPTAAWDGSMAYDAHDGYVVYYGGCAGTYNGGCTLSNQTWIYEYGLWFNATSGASPPPLEEAAMDYDAYWGIVLLYGGCGDVCPNNYTWGFQGGTWVNGTSSLTGVAPMLYGEQLTFANDSADIFSVLFGGCTDVYCFTPSNLTYGFDGFSWILLPETTAPAPEEFASFDYDPQFGASIYYGGANVGGYSNQTWYFYNFTWTNITSLESLLGPTPSARAWSVITYSELDNVLILYGGWDGFGSLGDTWELQLCGFFDCWVNVTSTSSAIPPMDSGAAPGISNYTAGTFITGGEAENASGYYLNSGTWVYEPVLSFAPTLSPSGPARSNVSAHANPSGGSASYAQLADTDYGEWQYGASTVYGDNVTLNFSTPGTYTVNASVTDQFGVHVASQLTFVATGPSSGITTAGATDVGVSLGLTATAATGGNAPYVYNWSFGDGSPIAVGLVTSHVWTAAGSYTVWLNVTDAEGLTQNTSTTVVVSAAPAATSHASATTIDAGQSVSFTSTVTGGAGTLGYSWTFGPGSTPATTTAPSYTFTTAGIYEVNLTVTDAVGAIAHAWLNVTVNPALGGTATVSAASVTTGTSDTFTATETGGTAPFTYAWVFGDGQTGTGSSATHSYATAKTYTATVWINDSAHASVSKTVMVTVTGSNGNGNGNKNTSSTNPLGGSTLWIIIAVVIVLIAIVGVVMMMRRKKPGSGAPAAPPAGASGSPPTPPTPPASGGSS